MKIRLPDLGATRCHYLTACGYVHEPSTGMRDWVRQLSERDRKLSIGYNTAGHQRAYARLLIGGRPDKTHLHVDLATRDAFREPPETTHRRRQFEAVFRRFEGASIQVGIEATFSVPVEDTQKKGGLINALAFNAKAEDLGIKLTGAEIEFQKAPIRRLSWSTREGRIWSSIRLERVTEYVDDGYLDRVVVNTQEIFETLCLGKERRDARRR